MSNARWMAICIAGASVTYALAADDGYQSVRLRFHQQPDTQRVAYVAVQVHTLGHTPVREETDEDLLLPGLKYRNLLSRGASAAAPQPGLASPPRAPAQRRPDDERAAGNSLLGDALDANPVNGSALAAPEMATDWGWLSRDVQDMSDRETLSDMALANDRQGLAQWGDDPLVKRSDQRLSVFGRTSDQDDTQIFGLPTLRTRSPDNWSQAAGRDTTYTPGGAGIQPLRDFGTRTSPQTRRFFSP